MLCKHFEIVLSLFKKMYYYLEWIMNYLINTTILFYTLNSSRKKSKLVEIDNALISSKLGILFALKTNKYVNFKGEQIELASEQLIVLKEVIIQHFNIDMGNEINMLAVEQEQSPINISNTTSVQGGIFNKIRGFLRVGPKIQEGIA
jgi:hypothetical protein